jgi:PAS domain S-box-containing protein
MKPSFHELVEIDELQSLCDILSKLTGFATAILDMEGNVLIATSWQEICTVFHRKNPETAEACRKSDTILEESPAPGERYRVYRCNNGLIDVSVPIMVENLQIGRLYTGQFLLDHPDMEFFRCQAAKYGFDESSYLEAVQKVPIVTEEQVDQVMEFLCRLAEMIGRMGLGNQRLREANEDLRVHRQEMERRVEERTAELSQINEQLQREIAERKRAEGALRESEEKYRVVADFTFDWETWLGPDGSLIYISPSCERITGYAADDFVNDPTLFTRLVHPDDRSAVEKHQKGVIAGDITSHQMDYRIITRDGGECWIEHFCQPAFGKDGKWLGQRASNRDITGRKMAEAMVSAALAEKEVLLKEVHHRVKNNMQIISTLLDLQFEKIADEQSLNALRESKDRINAMALLHENLYQSSDLASIDFAQYIERQVNFLFNSYMTDPERINLNIDVGHLQLDIDRAIPCGLIVNELVSNALKHAFPGERSGAISIGISEDKEDRITLTVADTGVGMPPGLDFSKTETLGLQLVNMLARQLGGQVSMESASGTAFTVRFQRVV